MPAKKINKFEQLFKDLDINETYSKTAKKAKEYTRVKDQIPLVKNFNYEADLLMLPETKEGFKYGLVVVDLASDKFDIEPLKTKEAIEVRNAFKTIFSRSYIKKPYSSIQTDGGNEFKGQAGKWMYDESILHKETLPDRHTQNANVESLNRQLGRLFNAYLNKKEIETGKQFKEWTNIIDLVREKLNKIREKKVFNKFEEWQHEAKTPEINLSKKSKYKVGDVVFRALDAPKDALGHNQSSKQFRSGDMRWDVKQPRKIVAVIPFEGLVPFRYLLDGIKNASFTENQLMLAPVTEQESKYIVEKIFDKKVEGKKIFYKVKWKGYLKKDSTWEPKEQLIKDNFELEIKEFENSLKDKK